MVYVESCKMLMKHGRGNSVLLRRPELHVEIVIENQLSLEFD